MLILTRKTLEEICIGDDIVISVASIRGDAVRLAITAPPHVPVHRREVYDKINRDESADEGE